jgi:mRNA interferase HigB
VHVVSRKALVLFATRHRDAAEPLDNWYRLTKKARWRNLADVKAILPHADLVGRCTVFNIGGNKYRLITKVKYSKQTVYIRFVLTHAEYNKGGWKHDCYGPA